MSKDFLELIYLVGAPEEINNIKQPNGLRVVSFFKDEPIAGLYLNSFILLISGYLVSIFKNNKKLYLPYLFFMCFFIFNYFDRREIKFNKSYLQYNFIFINIRPFKIKIKIIIFLLLIGSSFILF